ncbi:MAG: endonuclease [Acidobacteria bacterium]|nr:MAG: endonuclease [Acidobacteriota bacterium]
MNESCVSFASYNIHGCRGTDGRCDPQRIADVITEIEADVVGLQEVFSNTGDRGLSHLHRIADATNMQMLSGPTIRRTKAHYGNALLTRFEVLEVRHLNLSQSGREPRAALDVVLNVQSNPIRVLVTHLGLRRSERWHQIKVLMERINEGLQTILLGDMNEWLPFTRPLYWLRYQFGAVKALRTFPSWLPLLALDRIWVRPKESLLQVQVHDSRIARIASDHLPIKAEIRIL